MKRENEFVKVWTFKDVTRMRNLTWTIFFPPVIWTSLTDSVALPACVFFSSTPFFIFFLPFSLFLYTLPFIIYHFPFFFVFVSSSLLVSLHSSFYRLSFPPFCVFVSSSLLVSLHSSFYRLSFPPLFLPTFSFSYLLRNLYITLACKDCS